jgi:integrase
VRGRIEAVLDSATAAQWRKGDNPARWTGNLEHMLAGRSIIARVKHHPALPWGQIADFMAMLRAEAGVAARALEFTILTAARSGETLGATWGEIDMAAKVWKVPAERMKGHREHRVPLSDAALAVLATMKPLRDAAAGDYVFPGGKRARPLSNMAMTATLRRMKRGDITAHGFRSTFRDWCSDATDTPREIAEAALAHAVGDKVEAAYRRSDALAKRAALMAQWAAFCAPKASPADAAPATE